MPCSEELDMKRPDIRSIAVLGVAAGLLLAGAVAADPPGRPPGAPTHGGHSYAGYYPPRGHVVHALPGGYHTSHYHRAPYYYAGGVWYRPYGPYYRVIGPPLGITVGFLPDVYTTVWFGGMPYYYANSVYYVRRADAPGYVVTEPPAGVQPAQSAAASPASGEDFFMYPRNGQDEATQARDRYECHRWAVAQTGFDPTQPAGGVPAEQTFGRRSDYLRAIGACLDARGYTVR
jgi:hypothetical protein